MKLRLVKKLMGAYRVGRVRSSLKRASSKQRDRLRGVTMSAERRRKRKRAESRGERKLQRWLGKPRLMTDAERERILLLVV